jgi:hypothetical protein
MLMGVIDSTDLHIWKWILIKKIVLTAVVI